ncbi:hypothetical protein DAPK24_036590 [Pichia kluyveri]|uniref:Signal recognition particle subunit SRP14 n=1 Tax=Pichia kluyveri TaxID=36015 RepID=A0AAV5R6I0_PICKL|nr:hypothetical protein DAPK24_036590 [Pichia kluyveri]
MAILDNQEFFKQVTSLLTKNDGKSSIYITQKRYSYSLDDEIDGVEPFSDLNDKIKPIFHENKSTNKSYPILIRITDGNKDKSKKIKLSTIVEPVNLDSFWNEYTNILKSGLSGLKKKPKSKKKAKKASKKA